MNKIITIQAPAIDELGWEYPQAIVSFYHLGAQTYTGFDANEGDEEYKESSIIDSVFYKAGFWGNTKAKQLNKRSRPIYLLEDGDLLYDEDGEPMRVFEIDTSRPEYQSVVNNPNLSMLDKLRTIIEKHYRTEVAVL